MQGGTTVCSALADPDARATRVRPACVFVQSPAHCPERKAQRAMSLDFIETRYCQYVEEVINHHHLDRLGAYLTSDVVVHAPDVPPGLAGARQVLASYFIAFPDFHLTIEAVLALDGDLLARLTATGTHAGPFLGIVPTGR